jgi:hypothetical protein
MARARARRQAQSDDLIEAILASKGRPLPYRPEWWIAMIRWYYFRLPPPGAERVEAMRRPFDLRLQLERWRAEQIAHERATYHRPPDGEQ